MYKTQINKLTFQGNYGFNIEATAMGLYEGLTVKVDEVHIL